MKSLPLLAWTLCSIGLKQARFFHPGRSGQQVGFAAAVRLFDGLPGIDRIAESAKQGRVGSICSVVMAREHFGPETKPPLQKCRGVDCQQFRLMYPLRFDFSFHFQLHMCHDVLEEPDRNIKFSERLDVIVHVNLALFDLITLLFEFIGNVGVGH